MNLNDYRTTYHAESWENVAKVNGIMCAPIGAVRAVNALCDEIERKDAAIADLVSAVKAMLALDPKFTSTRIELIEDLAQEADSKMAKAVLIARKAIAKHDHIADAGKVTPTA